MLANKRLFVGSLLALTYCSSALASFVPHGWKDSDEGIWQISFEGEYFDQSNNMAELENFNQFNGTAPIGGSSSTLQFPPLAADPDQHWGFTINAGYIFASHKYDVRGSYTWLKSDTDFQQSGVSRALPDENPSANFPTHTSATFFYDFNEAEVTFGNFVKMTNRLMLRLGYGLAYANIKQHTNDSLSSLDCYACGFDLENITVNTSGEFSNEFQGIGPKFSLDGNFDLNRYAAVVGGFGLSALFGSSEAKLNYQVVDIDHENGNEFGSSGSFQEKDDKVAFGIDAKIGLRLAEAVSDDWAWNVEGGYKGTTYLNALQEGTLPININDHRTEYNILPGNSGEVAFEENYFNYGPYITLGIDFM